MIRKISADVVTPEEVVGGVTKAIEAGEVAHLYAVAVDWKGHTTIWASGDLKCLSLAAVALTAKASDVIREGQT